jgi:hypothetical protein
MEKTEELKKMIEIFELERDKLLDQVQYLKGNADRIEWVIRQMNSHIDSLENEDRLQQAQQLASSAAREAGNVGVHPKQRINSPRVKKTPEN